MAHYEVTYFDEQSGRVDMITVKASSEAAACEKVELMGECEVIEVERVNPWNVK